MTGNFGKCFLMGRMTAVKSLLTHLLARDLRSTRWESLHSVDDNPLSAAIASSCRQYFPELIHWSDEAIRNAYAMYWRECFVGSVEVPTSRAPDFLIYLFLLEYQVPDALGDFLALGAPLAATAIREIETIWLGDLMPSANANASAT